MLWEDCDDLVKTKLMRLAASLGKSAMLCRAETCHYCINGTMTDFFSPPPPARILGDDEVDEVARLHVERMGVQPCSARGSLEHLEVVENQWLPVE